MPTLKERLERKVQDYLSSDQVSKREQEAQEKKEKEDRQIKETIEKNWKKVEEEFDKLSPEQLIEGCSVIIKIPSWYHFREIREGLKERAEQDGIILVESWGTGDMWEALRFEVSK